MSKGMQLIAGASLFFLVVTILAGCNPDAFVRDNDPRLHDDHSGIGEHDTTIVHNHGPSSIVIGSYNIEKFGPSKVSKSSVTDILVDIVRRHDVMAIQELVSRRDDIIPRFLEMINADGSKFKAVIGPPQGYTSYIERYVIIYDSEKVAPIGQHYIARDPTQVLHRSPMVAHFRCLNVPPEQAFTFTMLNIHVDPDVVPKEHAALVDIVQSVRSTHPEEDDFIIIGDVNAPPRYFQNFPWLDNQFPVIGDEFATMTKGDRTRDNIVFDSVATSEYLNESGVMNVMAEYKLPLEHAIQVSDHLPIWSIFSTREAPAETIVADPRVVR